MPAEGIIPGNRRFWCERGVISPSAGLSVTVASTLSFPIGDVHLQTTLYESLKFRNSRLLLSSLASSSAAGQVRLCSSREKDEVSKSQPQDYGNEIADIVGHDGQHEQVGGKKIEGIEQTQDEPDHGRAAHPARKECSHT